MEKLMDSNPFCPKCLGWYITRDAAWDAAMDAMDASNAAWDLVTKGCSVCSGTGFHPIPLTEFE